MPEEENTPKLSVLEGREAPAQLVTDLKSLAGLSDSALKAIALVLERCLDPHVGEKAEQAIEGFAREHRVVGHQVAEAIRGLRFIFFAAAGLASEKHVLASDLDELCGERSELVREAVLGLYERVREGLRRGFIQRTILDHGRLMTDVGWRVDCILGSQHGRAMNANVALLTFNYQDGSERKRMTFHAEPAMLAKLRDACDQLLS